MFHFEFRMSRLFNWLQNWLYRINHQFFLMHFSPSILVLYFKFEVVMVYMGIEAFFFSVNSKFSNIRSNQIVHALAQTPTTGSNARTVPDDEEIALLLTLL